MTFSWFIGSASKDAQRPSSHPLTPNPYINNSEIIEMKSKMALGSKSKTSLKQGRMIFVLREG